MPFLSKWQNRQWFLKDTAWLQGIVLSVDPAQWLVINHLQIVLKSVESEVTWDLAILSAHIINHFTDIHSETRVQLFDSLETIKCFYFSIMALTDRKTW